MKPMPNRWKGKCHRCKAAATAHIMSMYSTEWICMECKDEERKRPDYNLAEAKDLREYAGRLRAQGMPRQADSVDSAASKLENRDVDNQ